MMSINAASLDKQGPKWGFLVRDIILLRRNSASLISMFIVPPLFLLCLFGVFGYAADQIHFDYLNFVLAGCVFQAAMFTAAASAMTVANDIDTSLIERVRTLPGAVSGFILGRLSTDLLRMVGSSVALFITAWLCGLTIDWSNLGLTFTWGLVTAAALSLFTNGIVLTVKDPLGAASSIQSLEMLLLMFSTAFIPESSLSGTLHKVVIHMPFSPIIELIRAPYPSNMEQGMFIEAVIWLAVVILIGILLIARRFVARSES